MPGEHEVQTAELVAPITVENDPATHALHTDMLLDAIDDDHVPLGHETQAYSDDAPIAVEYVPAGHELHIVAPITEEYIPA